jgi:drug/metabolite transporter (DMT)-like permease
MLATILIWSANYIVAKAALDHISPMAFNALRYVAAAGVVVAWWRWRERPQPLARRDGLTILGLGLWGYGVYQILFIVGLGHTTAGNSALFGSTSPLWTALIAMLWGRERLNRSGWFGMVLAFVGVSSVILGGRAHVSILPTQTLGDLLSLLAAPVWASFTVFSKDILGRKSYTQVVAGGMIAGAAFLVLAGLPSLLETDWGVVPYWVYPIIFSSGVLSNAVSYLVWANAVARVGPARTAIFLNLVPVLTLGMGALLLGEPIGWLQILGAAGVLYGVWRTTRA